MFCFAAGFRIIGRLPVVFHGGIFTRNRQFFIDIGDKASGVVCEPNSSEINEGAITFTAVNQGDDMTGRTVARDHGDFIPWKTCLV